MMQRGDRQRRLSIRRPYRSGVRCLVRFRLESGPSGGVRKTSSRPESAKGRPTRRSRNRTFSTTRRRRLCALLRHSQSYLLRRKAAGRSDHRNPRITDPDGKSRVEPVPICTTSRCLTYSRRFRFAGRDRHPGSLEQCAGGSDCWPHHGGVSVDQDCRISPIYEQRQLRRQSIWVIDVELGQQVTVPQPPTFLVSNGQLTHLAVLATELSEHVEKRAIAEVPGASQGAVPASPA